MHGVCRENAPLPDLPVVALASDRNLPEEKDGHYTYSCAAPPYKTASSPSKLDQAFEEPRDPSLSDTKVATRANESLPSLQTFDSHESGLSSFACHANRSRVSLIWNRVKGFVLGTQDVMPAGPVADAVIDDPPSHMSFTTPRSNSLVSSISTNNDASHDDIATSGPVHVSPELATHTARDADVESAEAESTLARRAGRDADGKRRQITLNRLFWAAAIVIILATIAMVALLCLSDNKKMTSAVFGGYIFLVAVAIGIAAVSAVWAP